MIMTNLEKANQVSRELTFQPAQGTYPAPPLPCSAAAPPSHRTHHGTLSIRTAWMSVPKNGTGVARLQEWEVLQSGVSFTRWLLQTSPMGHPILGVTGVFGLPLGSALAAGAGVCHLQPLPALSGHDPHQPGVGF